MRHLPVIVIAAWLVTLLSCAGGSTDSGQQSLMEASRQELATAVEDRDSLMALVRLISDDMEKISRIENVVSVTGLNADENPRQRARMLADLAAIRKTLQQRRERLAVLEGRLKESSLYSYELQGAIDAMRRQIDRQNTEMDSMRARLTRANETIGSLNRTVDSLNTAVTEVTGQKTAAETEATGLKNELNTCYYVAATKAELKTHNILETGFLRKTRLMKGDFDKTFFTTADKRCLRKIALPSQKASVLTNHPASSYRIVDVENQKTLTITDPERFWSLGNYLVIRID